MEYIITRGWRNRGVAYRLGIKRGYHSDFTNPLKPLEFEVWEEVVGHLEAHLSDGDTTRQQGLTPLERNALCALRSRINGVGNGHVSITYALRP